MCIRDSPQIKEVKLKTYKLKTVDHTNDKTIKICNLTVFGKLLISFFESSNIIFADSIKKFLILSIINLICLFYSFTNITVSSATLKPNFVIVALLIATLSSCLNIQSSKVTLISLPLTGTKKTYSNLNAGP